MSIPPNDDTANELLMKFSVSASEVLASSDSCVDSLTGAKSATLATSVNVSTESVSAVAVVDSTVGLLTAAL